MKPSRIFLCAGSVSGFLGVLAGAFGAHALKSRLDPHALAVFETAVRYQMLHVPVLLFLGLYCESPRPRLVHRGGWLFISGTLFFSGSLYILALSGIKILGAITPIGGLFLLAGWVCLFLSSVRA